MAGPYVVCDVGALEEIPVEVSDTVIDVVDDEDLGRCAEKVQDEADGEEVEDADHALCWLRAWRSHDQQ